MRSRTVRTRRWQRAILHPRFRFRGSLGASADDVDGFLGYARSIHAALAGFTCTIDDLIDAGNRVAARMTFSGTHQGRLFGVLATGREVSWSGAAFFTVDDERIVELWVLGDVDAVKHQLNASARKDGDDIFG